MVTVNLNLNNLSELPALIDPLGRYGNDYEYTTRVIFRGKIPPICSICNNPMVDNGYNPYTKKTLETSILVDTKFKLWQYTGRRS